MAVIGKRCSTLGDKFLNIAGSLALLLANNLRLVGSICKLLNIARDDELLTPVFKLFMGLQNR
jgi:hypothetical protein